MRASQISLILLLGSIVGCGNVNVAGPPTIPSTFNTAMLPPLEIVPNSFTISGNETMQLSPSGGVPPYSYLIISGGGTVGYTSGIYQAPSTSSDVVVEVFDSSGQSTQADITVNGSSPTGGTPGTTSDCSSIMNSPNIAARDSSASGVSDAMAYVAVSEVSECISYCDSIDAGYCSWWPATSSATSAVCVAWASVADVTPYNTTWQTYSGACTSP